MFTFDFSPLLRSTVGFDRLARLAEDASRLDETATSYPPYNIEVTDQDSYRITMAVAGFGEGDLNIETQENALVVAGHKEDRVADEHFLFRGIAGRDFVRRFQLADYVKVSGARLDNGLLYIDLVRELPEAMKPRKIEVTKGPGKLSDQARKLVETKVAA